MVNKNNFVPVKEFTRCLFLLGLAFINFILKLIILVLPLGFYILLMQLMSNKNSRISNITSMLPEESEWQYVFGNTVLVTTNPRSLGRALSNAKIKINNFVKEYKNFIFLGLVIYIIVMLYIIALVG
jgi:hypothetical protein